MTSAGRLHVVRPGAAGAGPVVYWMSREQRAVENPALLHAQAQALAGRRPLLVLFALTPAFLDATAAHFRFLLAGLAEAAATLDRHRIPFHLVEGDPAATVPGFLARVKAGLLVVDFDPLRPKRAWLASVLAESALPVHEVDGRNVVPCRVVSDKREWAARTLRPKLRRRLPEFLEPGPPLADHPFNAGHAAPPVDWTARLAARRGPDLPFAPGPAAAGRALAAFAGGGLARYHLDRNDPNRPGCSGLSPYLHFGQLSAARIVRDVRAAAAPADAKEAFIEELTVRRELADNFCHHAPDYDSLSALPDWSRAALERHAADPRVPVYDLAAFEGCATHDPLWNAAQAAMMATGKLHGYLRMYWAKKILEWSASPDAALRIAIRLNDRYELDGRETNGYVGILWALGGLHDRPWARRPIFGTVRFMAESGMRRKFDVAGYIRRHPVPPEPAC